MGNWGIEELVLLKGSQNHIESKSNRKYNWLVEGLSCYLLVDISR